MALIDLSQIVNLVYFASFFLIFFYGQRLQVQWQLVSVKRSLGKLERSKTAARQKFVDSISRFQMDKKTVETKIDRLNNSFTITPVSLDPSGIVGKLEHVLDTYDDHLDRKSTRLNSSHVRISYAVFCLKKKNQQSPARSTRGA